MLGVGLGVHFTGRIIERDLTMGKDRLDLARETTSVEWAKAHALIVIAEQLTKLMEEETNG